MTGNILMYILIYFVLQILAGFATMTYYAIKYFNSNIDKEQLQLIINRSLYISVTISALITLLIYVLLFKNKEENIWKRCKFKAVSFNNALLVILTSTGAVSVTAFLVNHFQNKFESYKTVSKSMSYGVNTIAGLICVIIFIPIFEEILFRGLIFIELKKTANIVISIILQALIFGVFHGNLLQGIYTFALGIILSILYIWLDSIWAPIICHITYNLMGTLVFPILIYVSGKYSFVYAILGLVTLLYGLFNIKKFYSDANNNYINM